MVAPLDSNPSYIWRSLMWSRQLLKKRISWRTGKGESVRIYLDHWIPGFRSQIQAPRGQGNFVTVSELMVNGAWNKPLVQTIFAPHIAQEILAIPLPTIPPKDSRLWPFDSKGKYSVRDGYKVEIGSYESPSHYSLVQSKQWWSYIWSLLFSLKSEFFGDEFYKKLSQQQEISSHHVPEVDACPLCSSDNDSTEHVLFWCSGIRNCWNATLY
ncbi:uncharacterized protein LOC142544228 [Primulina tabacum]|uniref:uncharacterized protein LOC142544227 n=1 Tax=Primulina tabacum TaxID=48773 RepID=UPI003F595F7E